MQYLGIISEFYIDTRIHKHITKGINMQTRCSACQCPNSSSTRDASIHEQKRENSKEFQRVPRQEVAWSHSHTIPQWIVSVLDGRWRRHLQVWSNPRLDETRSKPNEKQPLFLHGQRPGLYGSQAKPHTDQDYNLTNVQTKSDSNKNNYS
jgi:hypothetical protein